MFEKIKKGMCNILHFYMFKGGHRGCVLIEVRFTTTCAINAYRH